MQLSIITLGHVHAEALVALAEHFTHLENLALDVPYGDAVAKHRAEFNRAVDAATADWILIVREHEVIDPAIAKEIAETVAAAKAWGFRLRAVPYYAGAPLRLGTIDRGGEVRLFHKRHYLRFAAKGEWDEIAIQGTIVRMSGEIRSVTFASSADHEAWLEKSAERRSAIARVMLFARYLTAAATLDRNTIRYLWIEAGFRPR
jgi:hypothetical protein